MMLFGSPRQNSWRPTSPVSASMWYGYGSGRFTSYSPVLVFAGWMVMIFMVFLPGAPAPPWWRGRGVGGWFQYPVVVVFLLTMPVQGNAVISQHPMLPSSA